MVTVNSISATPRASMGRGLSSLEPGERRAQRSASTLSPDYLALHRSRFVSLFLSALLFSSFLYLLIHSILLFPSFSLQPPLFPRETPSLVLRTVFFLLLYLLYFSFLPLPLLFYNPFIIFFFFFFHTENSTSSILSIFIISIFFPRLDRTSSPFLSFLLSILLAFLKSLLPLPLASYCTFYHPLQCSPSLLSSDVDYIPFLDRLGAISVPGPSIHDTRRSSLWRQHGRRA